MPTRTGRAMTLALLLLLGATAAIAGVRDELANLRTAAGALLAGGGLDGAGKKAVEKVISAIEKAEALPPEEELKLLKKVSGVLKKVEKAARKGADLSPEVPALLDALAADVAGRRDRAEGLVALLVAEKDLRRAQRSLDRGVEKQTRAAGEALSSRRAGLYAKAAKLLDRAGNTAQKLFEKEVRNGTIRLRIEKTTLDDLPTGPGGEPIVPPGFPLLISLNLFVDPATLPSGVFQLLTRPGGVSWGGEIQIAPVLDDEQNPALLLTFDPPPEPGTYTLRILGGDSGGAALATPEGVLLPATVEYDLNVQ